MVPQLPSDLFEYILALLGDGECLAGFENQGLVPVNVDDEIVSVAVQRIKNTIESVDDSWEALTNWFADTFAETHPDSTTLLINSTNTLKGLLTNPENQEERTVILELCDEIIYGP